MTQQPLSCRRQAGVLYLTLDTPGSSVNIFDLAAAQQLTQLLAGVTAENTRCVVLRSAKPGSFVNGGMLLMAKTFSSVARTRQAAAPVRRAYRCLEQVPVPTVAAIRGACYGCGLELSLRCDFRLAADTIETHFYMTELADYLVNTLYEGALRLPLLLGLERALDLLLWGQWWTAGQALAGGLVQRVWPDRGFDGRVRSFARSLRHKPDRAPAALPRDLEPLLLRTRQRIQRLPPAHHKLFTDCLELMLRVARRGHLTEGDRRVELTLFARSLRRDSARQALSFFFIRQVAGTLALAGEGPPVDGPLRVRVCPGPGSRARAFAADLRRRRLPGVSLSVGPAAEGLTELRLRPRGPAAGQPRASGRASVLLELDPRAPWPGLGLGLYNPFFAAGWPLLELAAPAGEQPGQRALLRYLQRAGFKPIPTRPASGPLIDRWIAAYLAPLLRHLARGGAPATVERTLRSFGFCRRPPELLAALGRRRQLARLLAPRLALPRAELRAALGLLARPAPRGGRHHRPLLDALLVSLAATTVECLEQGTLAHPTLVDLLAREALAFPLRHCSLCTHLGRQRLERLLRRAPRYRALVADSDLERVDAFFSSGRRLYL